MTEPTQREWLIDFHTVVDGVPGIFIYAKDPRGTLGISTIAVCNSSGNIPREEQEANARIMRASKEMLASLKEMIECLSGILKHEYSSTDTSDRLIERARGTIAEAEGRS
jgi:hypothetical protein